MNIETFRTSGSGLRRFGITILVIVLSNVFIEDSVLAKPINLNSPTNVEGGSDEPRPHTCKSEIACDIAKVTNRAFFNIGSLLKDPNVNESLSTKSTLKNHITEVIHDAADLMRNLANRQKKIDPPKNPPNLNQGVSEVNAPDASLNSDRGDSDSGDFQKHIDNIISDLDTQSLIAKLILETSLRSIQVLYPETQNDPDQLLKTAEHMSCIFIIETQFGDNTEHDNCDQTNIAQIRLPAYQEVLNQSREGGMLESFDIKSVLGKDMNWNLLHPYELPMCCNALKNNELRSENSCSSANNIENCVTAEKRTYLESQEWMYDLPKEDKKSAESSPEIRRTLLSELFQTVVNVLVNSKDRVKNTLFHEEPKESENTSESIEPVKCKSTTNKEYFRVPAIPSHSIFTGIAYSKTEGYHNMSDKEFIKWAPNKYNRAGSEEKRRYGVKAASCLKTMYSVNPKLNLKNIDILKKYITEFLNNQNRVASAVNPAKNDGVSNPDESQSDAWMDFYKNIPPEDFCNALRPERRQECLYGVAAAKSKSGP